MNDYLTASNANLSTIVDSHHWTRSAGSRESGTTS